MGSNKSDTSSRPADQMRPRNVDSGRAILVFLGLMAASLAALLVLPPIHQDQGYHHFADDRKLFGVPNFWNVVSNLPFIGWELWGSGNFIAILRSRDLPGDISDGHWFLLLPLGSERPHAVLGQTTHDALLHGDPHGHHRRAR